MSRFVTIPNILTLFRIGLTPLFLALLIEDYLKVALVLFIIAGITDGLDGLIARLFNQKSSLGAYLDPVADKILLVSSAMVLAWLGFVPLWFASIIVLRDVLIVSGVSLLVIADIPFQIRPSIIGKLTTLSQLVVVLTVMGSTFWGISNEVQGFLLSTAGIFTILSGMDYFRRWTYLWKVNDGSFRIKESLYSKIYKLWFGESPSFPLRWAEIVSIPYRFGVLVKKRLDEKKLVGSRKFVISVGNVVVGGSGKTPFVVELSKRFNDLGYITTVICRNLGSAKFSHPVKIDPWGEPLHKLALGGDEPNLIASRLFPYASVWVGPSKRDTLLQVEACEPDSKVVIIDDGFQHWSIERDLDIVIFNEELFTGNGFLLPLGPLREPLTSLERADVVVFMGGNSDPEGFASRLDRLRPFLRKNAVLVMCKRVLDHLFLAAQEIPLDIIRRKKCFLFAGIAHPGLFFDAVKALGIDVVGTRSFRDHYLYTMKDIEDIVHNAYECSADIMITTEKDFLKIPEPFKTIVGYFQMKLECSDAMREIIKVILGDKKFQ